MADLTVKTVTNTHECPRRSAAEFPDIEGQGKHMAAESLHAGGKTNVAEKIDPVKKDDAKGKAFNTSFISLTEGKIVSQPGHSCEKGEDLARDNNLAFKPTTVPTFLSNIPGPRRTSPFATLNKAMDNIKASPSDEQVSKLEKRMEALKQNVVLGTTKGSGFDAPLGKEEIVKKSEENLPDKVFNPVSAFGSGFVVTTGKAGEDGGDEECAVEEIEDAEERKADKKAE